MLFNYLFAKQNNGSIVFRLEDTDKERSKGEYEANIIESLQWLGITFDEGPFRQSERTALYREALTELVANGKAYVSKEPAKDDPSREVEVIRLKNPGQIITFTDVVRGDISFDTTELGDFVIAKNMEEPLYHLAVVSDDHTMGVTHVIRGEDHISNTPRQILIQEAFGYERPVYAHIPLILAPDRSKLSKRHGATAVTEYREQGYLPGAVLNYLALLGWNPGTEQEIFTMEELIAQFDLQKIQKGGAIFDQKKLDWVNKEHVKRLPPEEQRALVLKSIEHEPYMVGEPTLDVATLVWKKATAEETIEHLEKVLEIISKGGGSEEIMAYANEEGKACPPSRSVGSRRGNVLWPLRYSLTGAQVSPDPLTMLQILGQEKSLKRLEHAIMVLKNAAL